MKNKIICITAIMPSLFFLLLYLPVWNGKHFSLANFFTLTFFVVMAVIFLLDAIGIFIYFTNEKIEIFKNIAIISNILAVPIFLFFFYFFILTFFNLPVLPPQN